MTPLNFGLFAVDQPAAVYFGGQRLDLTPMAARILTKLARLPGGVPRAELIGTNGGVAKSDTLRVHIHAVRQALPRELGVEYLPEREAYRIAMR